MGLLAILRVVLAILSLRGARWAYVGFIVSGLLYFPATVAFHFAPKPCELTFDIPLAIHSLTNFPHIVLFAFFVILTSAQFRQSNWSALIWTLAATIAMGVLVEIAEGVTGTGHCRSRDLIPDAVGGLAGVAVVLLLTKLGWRPRPSWSLFGWAR